MIRTSRLESLRERLFAPVDISPLVFLRIVFGLVMFWEVCRYRSHGWIDQYYSPSKFHFTYYGFEWVRPWPGHGMHWHFAALGVAALCVATGLFYRLAAALFFVGFSYVFLLDEAHYLNHFYLVCLISFLLIFVPADRSCSLDVWLRRKRRSDVVPAWSLWLMRAQVAVPYLFGGLAKLNSDWLHGEPMRTWLGRRANFPVIGPFVHDEPVVWFFTIGGLFFDLLIVPCLLWRRTRVPAFLAAVSFHLLNAWLFQIGIFPWLMLAASLIFFPPELSRRVLEFLRLPIGSGAADDELFCSPVRRRAIPLLIAAYLAVQVLIPLRHFLYPGNVNWTEEGHRFSWHMKLRDKHGKLRFFVRDASTGREWMVDPDKRVPGWQLDMLTTHPDMILQYSHYIAAQNAQRGFPNVEVRARALVSLSSRRPQPLVDSTIDLSKVQRSLHHARWILPLEEPLRAAGGRATDLSRKTAGD